MPKRKKSELELFNNLHIKIVGERTNIINRLRTLDAVLTPKPKPIINNNKKKAVSIK
jgi:hypothetical protein